jgi:hypothetical protein
MSTVGSAVGLHNRSTVNIQQVGQLHRDTMARIWTTSVDVHQVAASQNGPAWPIDCPATDLARASFTKMM